MRGKRVKWYLPFSENCLYPLFDHFWVCGFKKNGSKCCPEMSSVFRERKVCSKTVKCIFSESKYENESLNRPCSISGWRETWIIRNWIIDIKCVNHSKWINCVMQSQWIVLRPKKKIQRKMNQDCRKFEEICSYSLNLSSSSFLVTESYWK